MLSNARTTPTPAPQLGDAPTFLSYQRRVQAALIAQQYGSPSAVGDGTGVGTSSPQGHEARWRTPVELWPLENLNEFHDQAQVACLAHSAANLNLRHAPFPASVTATVLEILKLGIVDEQWVPTDETDPSLAAALAAEAGSADSVRTPTPAEWKPGGHAGYTLARRTGPAPRSQPPSARSIADAAFVQAIQSKGPGALHAHHAAFKKTLAFMTKGRPIASAEHLDPMVLSDAVDRIAAHESAHDLVARSLEAH